MSKIQSESKVETKEAEAIRRFRDNYIARKNRKLIRSETPSFFVSDVWQSGIGLLSFEMAHHASLKFRMTLPMEEWENFEVISKQEHDRLQDIYENCQQITNRSNETSTHFREDGQEKVQFDKHNFVKSLYALQLKFPNYKCEAYVCRDCGKIHLGKTQFPPSFYYKRGVPFGGVWRQNDDPEAAGKEWIAYSLALVLARSGDEWKSMTLQEVTNLLPESEHFLLKAFLKNCNVEEIFNEVRDFIIDEHKGNAYAVGGKWSLQPE